MNFTSGLPLASDDYQRASGPFYGKTELIQ